MRLRTVIASLALAIVTAAVTVTAGAPAQASGTGNQWCYEAGGQACLNAWGGGPRVNVEVTKGAVNNDFTLVYNNNGHGYQLQLTNGGLYSGQCVGDYGNDPNNASTGLVTCGLGSGGNPGWGTLFDLGDGCGAPGYVFQNRHWSSSTYRAILDPPNGFVNGSHFYLNGGASSCFYYTAPA